MSPWVFAGCLLFCLALGGVLGGLSGYFRGLRTYEANLRWTLAQEDDLQRVTKERDVLEATVRETHRVLGATLHVHSHENKTAVAGDGVSE